MDKITAYHLSDDFIARLADWVQEEVIDKGSDASRLCFVFGGKRPALFLKRELAKKLKKSYLAPAFFSIDEFTEHLAQGKGPWAKISDLDAAYLIFQLAKKHTPSVLEGRRTFAAFLPWAKEILSFIEQLDLEDISLKSLKDIQLHAAIGYDVPDDINRLLRHIVTLRQVFHEVLFEQKLATRGLLYRQAAEASARAEFPAFDHILFCNFFYCHKTEEQIFKVLRERGKALFFFQGDPCDWTVLSRVAKNLNVQLQPTAAAVSKAPEISYHAGFDLHSQVCLVREILKSKKSLDRAVIVLPEPNSIIPLLSEIAVLARDFNVSLGYPLNRSSLYALLEVMFAAQQTRKNNSYYAKDYLKVLSHPLVKNLSVSGPAAATRILVHKIEEVLTGIVKTPLAGSLFLDLKDIEELPELTHSVLQTTGKMELGVSRKDLEKILRTVHEMFFRSWQDVTSFEQFASSLEQSLDFLARRSPLAQYPLNLNIVEEMFRCQREFAHASFRGEVFAPTEIFKIFQNRLKDAVVSFSGSPLKGLQILGLFETRALAFDHVIVLDANEGVLPRLKVYEPLIPRDVMMSLGLNRLEKEDEIQRYQFLRLIAGAQKVHLVYQKSADKEKSRFIEELIWKEEKKTKTLDAGGVQQGRFRTKVLPKEAVVAKTDDVAQFLKTCRYSASSINTYLHCPLRFYYQYVLGLEEKEDLLDEPEAADIGNFVHELLETTFRPWVGHQPKLDEKFKKHFLKEFELAFERDLVRKMKSDAFLTKEVLEFRLKIFLEHEEQRQVKVLLGVEKTFLDTIPLAEGEILFKCKIDRIDRLVDESLLVLDYKTGSGDVFPSRPEKIEATDFSRSALKKTVKSFQLPIYLYFVQKENKDAVVNAGLYSLRAPEGNGILKCLFGQEDSFGQRQSAMALFMRALDAVTREILDAGVPFVSDDTDPHYCQNCPFFYLCR
ncbi:MAG: PD-(D/E)XK nuclease family protein [Candidatus Omnitrophota bacterium]